MSARWFHTDYKAFCTVCDWHEADQDKSASVVDEARRHNRETGHSVHAERSSVLIYPPISTQETTTNHPELPVSGGGAE